MELKEYLSVIKRKWWVLALTLVICVGAAFLYTSSIKPVYQASADLIVNKPIETSTGQTQVDQNSINTNLMLVNTYKQIISSEAITKSVVKQHPELNLTAQQLSNKITINSVKDTQVINVTVRDSSYQRAATIVNSVSDVFINRVTEIMKVNNVTILNAADPTYNAGPVNNNQTVLIILSLVVGLLLGLGIIFLLDYLDDSVRTEHDLEQVLGIKLLSKVEHMNRGDLNAGSTMQQTEKPVLRPANE
ncbi:Wzz/FepE/Etk N-terminal domain-containing protein [Paenibacillus sp. JX-17]|uniref:Wzz/FepE/Etk N-terminal domain-containing protein n=1 Tax=Paenibacillus lacisoli TaxID=3064525 RepID=A0ABT9CGM6_9BACL|nr:Wzz/FepE/Etk N-terminal domain-containing protein [Paenibacillus sp. JX-17]MDO7908400.1 Wzz/FepE/Etk N-terminal domain-containing protein [Paenibacillus sp. JX-17]